MIRDSPYYYYGVRFGEADPIAFFNTFDKALEYSKKLRKIYKGYVNIKEYILYERSDS